MSHVELVISDIFPQNTRESNWWPEQASSAVAAETTYAILSHRWLNKGELSFQDLSKLADVSMAGFRMASFELQQSTEGKFNSATVLDLAQVHSKRMPTDKPRNGTKLLEMMADFCVQLSANQKASCAGLVKFVEFCVIAGQQQCKYAWMDTCCIDKTRSAELEESIRSMFRWYSSSKICVVHLTNTWDPRSCNQPSFFDSMRRDAWFTRGWTLQELLAPTSIKFFAENWQPITDSADDKVADADNFPLWKTISEITGIDVPQLLNFKPGMHRIRDIMVWASKRETTRMEDVAYSLIGMLDVPLSIAYGEGRKAFYRLQLEIVHSTHHKAIFAWQGESSAYNSMFAASPKCFSPANFRPLPLVTVNSEVDRTHTVTNYGIRIPLSLYQADVAQGPEDGEQASRQDVEGAGEEEGEEDSDSEVDLEEHHETARSGEPTPYVLKVAELGTISVVSRDALWAYDRLVIAILANGQRRSGKSLALLLGYRARHDQYTRLATDDLIWVERLPTWVPTITIYIK